MGPPAGLVDEDSKAAVKYKEYIAVRMCGGSPSRAARWRQGGSKKCF